MQMNQNKIVTIVSSTQAGKTTLVSKLAKITLKTGDGHNSCTKEVNCYQIPSSDVYLRDTPGLADSDGDEQRILQLIKQSLDQNPFTSGFVFVFKNDVFSQSHQNILKKIKLLFRQDNFSDVEDRFFFVITHVDAQRSHQHFWQYENLLLETERKYIHSLQTKFGFQIKPSNIIATSLQSGQDEETKIWYEMAFNNLKSKFFSFCQKQKVKKVVCRDMTIQERLDQIFDLKSDAKDAIAERIDAFIQNSTRVIRANLEEANKKTDSYYVNRQLYKEHLQKEFNKLNKDDQFIVNKIREEIQYIITTSIREFDDTIKQWLKDVKFKGEQIENKVDTISVQEIDQFSKVTAGFFIYFPPTTAISHLVGAFWKREAVQAELIDEISLKIRDSKSAITSQAKDAFDNHFKYLYEYRTMIRSGQ